MDDRWQERLSALVDGEVWPWDRWRLRMHLGRCPECRMLYEQMRAVRRLVRERAPRPEAPATLWQVARARFGEGRRPFVFFSVRRAVLTSVATAIAVLTVFAGSWGGLRPTRQPHAWLDALQAHYLGHRTGQRAAVEVAEAAEAASFPVDLSQFGLLPAEQGPCEVGTLPGHCHVYRSTGGEHCVVITRVQGLCQRIAGICPARGEARGCIGGCVGKVRMVAFPVGGACVFVTADCGQAEFCRLGHAVARALTARASTPAQPPAQALAAAGAPQPAGPARPARARGRSCLSP